MPTTGDVQAPTDSGPHVQCANDEHALCSGGTCTCPCHLTHARAPLD